MNILLLQKKSRKNFMNVLRKYVKKGKTKKRKVRL